MYCLLFRDTYFKAILYFIHLRNFQLCVPHSGGGAGPLRVQANQGLQGGDHPLPEALRGLLRHPDPGESPVQPCEDVPDKYCDRPPAPDGPGPAGGVHTGEKTQVQCQDLSQSQTSFVKVF